MLRRHHVEDAGTTLRSFGKAEVSEGQDHYDGTIYTGVDSVQYVDVQEVRGCAILQDSRDHEKVLSLPGPNREVAGQLEESREGIERGDGGVACTERLKFNDLFG